MNFQRVISLVKKDLKRLIRDPGLLFLIVLFPVVLTLLFGFSFGAIGGSQSTTYQIGVVYMDTGSYSKWSEFFLGNITNVEILNIQFYSDRHSGSSRANKIYTSFGR